MARFRGVVQGNRSEASRLGHERIDAYADGWNIGVYATAFANGDSDFVGANVTGGSNGNNHISVGFRYDSGSGRAVTFLSGYEVHKNEKGAILIKGPAGETILQEEKKI